jgi:phthiocerol/phenolphthiocerol synthesis type-I polyketide synthase B
VTRASSRETRVAIVGIGCRFPGAVVDADSFWRLLVEGRDAIGEIPSDRFDLAHYYDERPATPGHTMSRWGGYLDRIQEFDAMFFGISPVEAERLDPQQRLLLECAWEALENAGQNVTQLAGTPTGVFVGQWTSDFESRLFADPANVDFFMTTGSGRYAASGRISYALGLRGPSMTLDTACSSSLAAVLLAARSIRDGDSTLALAGAVNIILQPHISIAYSQARMMAPDGRCKFGDVSGDGYVRSEGAAVVVLKDFDRAVADGDRIYAVIRGGAVNNDGSSSGSLGRPSRIGQEELLRSAYRDAGIAPSHLGYVEAHGTGTRVGDPVELGALETVLRESGASPHQTLVGSVKTNIGHTEGAAGIAGLIKAALALHKGLIPPSLHFKTPNPQIPWSDVPFRIPSTCADWPQRQPRVAGVSAFGIGGTNVHVVVEQAPVPAPAPATATNAPAVLPLSARSADALRAVAGRYRDLLADEDVPPLHDVCWSAATLRTPLEWRAVFVAADRAGMREQLSACAAGEGLASDGDVANGSRPRVAFVCPGQGAQWTGMARELMEHDPVFRSALAECDAAARPYVTWSIVEQLHAEPGSAHYLLDRIDVIQPVLVALSIAYARMWRAFGIEPDAVVGHSMGEVAAAHIAGVLSLDQAMRIICRRSALMRRASGKGAMALVDLSMEATQARLQGVEDRVTIAVSNSPRSSVISGDPDAVAQVLARLEADGVFCRLIKVDVASHSPQMDGTAADLAGELHDLIPGAAAIPVYSTVLARRAEGHEFSAGYWGRNVRKPVRFAQTVLQLLDDGVTTFVELGPHPILMPSIEQTAASVTKTGITVALGRRNEPEVAALLSAVGTLWCAGCPVDWARVLPAGRRVELPVYPWQRERLWVDVAEPPIAGQARRAVVRPDTSTLEWLYQVEWRSLGEAVRRRADGLGRILVLSGDRDASALVVSSCVRASLPATATIAAELADRLREHPAATIVVLAADDDSAYAPIAVTQQVVAAQGQARPRLWFVTRGAQSVRAGERVSVEQASLWGAARVVAEEHPDLWGGLIDLDRATSIAADAEMLIEQIGAGDGEDQIALRGGERFALRLARGEKPAPATLACRPDSAYLITGGLGEIGLHVARALAAAGARRLVLLGRTPLPPRDQWAHLAGSDPLSSRVAAVRDLELRGVAVHTAAVDVADESQLRAFLQRYECEAWPPIRGVVHAAGELRNALVRDMDRATFDRVVAPKVEGARLLDRLLPGLDFFVLFSSTGAFLAQPGQANYAAANAGLDAVACDRRSRGLPAVSINWGVWAQTGLVRGQAGEQNVEEMRRKGISAFAAAQAIALFPTLCGWSHPSVAVLPIEWSVFSRSRAGRSRTLYRDFCDNLPDSAAKADFGAELSAVDQPKRRQILDRVVRETLGRVLKIAPSRLDPRKALGAMGLNSLMAMELRNRLEAALERPLSATLAWNYPTIDALVDYLAHDGRDVSMNAAEPSEAPADDPSETAIDISHLSDDDAVLALRSRI